MKSKNSAKIAQLKAELAKLEKEDADFEAMSEDKRIATHLHEKLCHHNHTDGCGWHYDRGDWTEYSRREYLMKANQVIRFSAENNVPTEKLLNFLSLIK